MVGSICHFDTDVTPRQNCAAARSEATRVTHAASGALRESCRLAGLRFKCSVESRSMGGDMFLSEIIHWAIGRSVLKMTRR